MASLPQVRSNIHTAQQAKLPAADVVPASPDVAVRPVNDQSTHSTLQLPARQDPVLGKRKSGTLDQYQNVLDTPRFNVAIDRVLGAKPSDDEAETMPAIRQTHAFSTRQQKKTKRAKKQTQSASAGDTANVSTTSDSPFELLDLSDNEADSEQVTETRRGRQPQKSRWARAHFGNEPKACKMKGGKLVWERRCNWCNVVCTLPRSSGKVKFNDEPKPPSLSNLISHLDNCKRLLKSASFEAQQVSNEQASGNIVTIPE
ncbi:hypothetical protein BC629DRAFT_1442903 [Irpex lacteus]|nr:hypothetical protein BC629DRAFT_1442903 [Irpex lacteus]